MQKNGFTLLEKILLIILGVLVVGSITFFIWLAQYREMRLAKSPEDLAWFGDYIGGVIGTLVGLVGVVFLFRTYSMQLSISESQYDQSQRIRFESAFFNLLEKQRNIAKDVEGSIREGAMSVTCKGGEFFSKARVDLQIRLLELDYEPNMLTLTSAYPLKSKICTIYNDFYEVYNTSLGHYFRHLYHLLKFVKDNAPKEESKKYADMVQAQMSIDELYLVCFNGISNYGRRKMLPLMDEFSLLENLIVADDEKLGLIMTLFYPQTKLKTIHPPTKNIIFIGGVHCVGKDSFKKIVLDKYPQLSSMSCSEILKWEDSTTKVVENVTENQLRLVESLRDLVDMDKPYLLDGHFALWNKELLPEVVPNTTFVAINPAFIILLQEDIKTIQTRLLTRDGVNYSEDSVKALADLELAQAQRVAGEHNIDLFIVNNGDTKNVDDRIQEFLKQFY